MAHDIGIENHRAWLGYLQPVGLIVSPHALVQCQAYLDLNVFEEQMTLRSLMSKVSLKENESVYLDPERMIDLFVKVLGWRESDLKSASENTEFTSLFLPEYQESISATHFVFEKKGDTAPVALGLFLDNDEDLDAQSQTTTWKASHQVKFERLLREKNVAIGFIISPSRFRLVFAPKGESSGYVTFPFHLMLEVQGRIVLAAFKMLMNEGRWFTLPSNARLPALLTESRKYQNVVSTQLSEQVLAALYELLRGLQSADNHCHGELLRGVLEKNRNDVYHGCLTVLLRTVFLLYAEDRELIPAHPIYAENYSIKGLFERLRADESRYADTMDQRYGAWAQLITLFRIVYEGVDFPGFRLPARHGHLFEPNRFLFLEGRISASDSINPPLVSDGVLFRVLNNLMMLDGERISYRSLDVEQIGSVYETVMGFQLEIATGPSVAIKPKKVHGAPVVIDLEACLRIKKSERVKWLMEKTDQEISAISNVESVDELETALAHKIAKITTPVIVTKGAMILQPSDERRRSGSHYTPRLLTEPIVKKAIEPFLAEFKNIPTPDQILSLKLCDPAMGSGAFLVEAVRQLSEILIKSWRFHKQLPNIPSDEDELLFARRQIAQRCIYGVDKNPMAVDLAKMSLWLSTFAKDHSFTFLDHSLKVGDSLVGLNLDQIARSTWEKTTQDGLFTQSVTSAVKNYIDIRKEIVSSSQNNDYESLVSLNENAQWRVQKIRAAGNLILDAFFAGKTDRERKLNLVQKQPMILKMFQTDSRIECNEFQKMIQGFHWELEFPEVFQRTNSGFDIIVGNPPFLGGRRIRSTFGEGYLYFITECQWPNSSANADLCAFFLLRCNELLRKNGVLGLILSSSVGEGDTRETGLQRVIASGSHIFSGYSRFNWAGIANVTIVVVHVYKGNFVGKTWLNDEMVSEINSYLEVGASSEIAPKRLSKNSELSYQGSILCGMGFVLEQAEADRILNLDAKYQDVIYRSIGAQDLNIDPKHTPSGWLINFHDWPLERTNDIVGPVAEDYPECISILKAKVYPERTRLKEDGEFVLRKPLPQKWWQYADKRPKLYKKLNTLEHAFAIATKATKYIAFAKVTGKTVYFNSISVLATDDYGIAAVLSSNIHEIWARKYGGYNLQLIQYAPTDLLETFPLPKISKELQKCGKEFFEVRSRFMENNDVGLTDTYNLINNDDVSSEDVKQLRDAFVNLDNKVLDAYLWNDLSLKHGFYSTNQGERFTVSPIARESLLTRLLNLNIKLAEEEKLTGEIQLNASRVKKKNNE